MAKSVKSAAKKKTSKKAAAPAKRAKTASKKAAKATKATAARQKAGGNGRPRATQSRESQDARRARAARILKGLRELYPDADCALHHRSAYELLTATILSAQCTDERVNQVTPDFFRRYPNPAALAEGTQEDVEALIKSTGFFRNKTKSLLGFARKVCDEHGGEIPDEMEALLELPGVARKTANCVLGTWFEKNEGIVVDTHVGRLALRMKLLTSARDDKDAVKIERDLMELFPREAWTYLSHALIQHGRRVCAARKPKCEECALAANCPSAGKVANGSW